VTSSSRIVLDYHFCCHHHHHHHLHLYLNTPHQFLNTTNTTNYPFVLIIENPSPPSRPISLTSPLYSLSGHYKNITHHVFCHCPEISTSFLPRTLPSTPQSEEQASRSAIVTAIPQPKPRVSPEDVSTLTCTCHIPPLTSFASSALFPLPLPTTTATTPTRFPSLTTPLPSFPLFLPATITPQYHPPSCSCPLVSSSIVSFSVPRCLSAISSRTRTS